MSLVDIWSTFAVLLSVLNFGPSGPWSGRGCTRFVQEEAASGNCEFGVCHTLRGGCLVGLLPHRKLQGRLPSSRWGVFKWEIVSVCVCVRLVMGWAFCVVDHLPRLLVFSFKVFTKLLQLPMAWIVFTHVAYKRWCLCPFLSCLPIQPVYSATLTAGCVCMTAPMLTSL